MLLAVFVGIALAVGVVVACFSFYQRERARVEAALLAACDRYGGRIEASFWTGKKLKFPVDQRAGISGELTYFRGSDNAPPFTKLHVRWAGPSLRVHPEKRWGKLKKLFGAQDVQVGDRAFDERFLVQGDPTYAKEALTPAARRKLMLLYRLGKTEGVFGGNRAGITLDVTPAGVILKCPRNLTRERVQLLSFLEHALAVISELRAAASGAPPISVAEVVKAGKCPVCSDGGGSLDRRCRGCNAAYHAECWDYLGGCAIFGCEDRYRPEQPRQRDW